MLVFAIFVDKITLVCILSPNAPLGGKFVGLPSLNEILCAKFHVFDKKCTIVSQMKSANLLFACFPVCLAINTCIL